ncbi:MAG: hypothetical protein QGF53_10995 [Alphaproteobacteria bacterium]|jgi:hypothetical protein|nr:hypothetical protein [Alphaproteobacteria bacterium]
MGNECAQRQQGLGFVSQWRRILIAAAAQVDALFQIDRTTLPLVEHRISCGNTRHLAAVRAMASGAGLVSQTPEIPAGIDPEHAGIGEGIVLQGLRVGGLKGVAGLHVVCLCGICQKAYDDTCKANGFHSTAIVAEAENLSPY